MERFYALEVADEHRWLEMLNRVGRYDVYHLPSYHRLSEISGEGKGIFLNYVRGDLVIVFPLLIRRIDSIPGLESIGQNWYDAVSVYGYAGPIASREVSIREKVSFWGYLKEYFDSARLVSIFSSVHPLLGQEFILNGFGEIVPTNPTISIDLTLPSDVQWSNYRKSHRNGINRLIKKGFVCIEDKEKCYWDEFINLYYNTMKRLNATSYYYFPKDYFLFIKENMSDLYKLFICFFNNEIVNASIYTYCQGIIQAQLEGVREEYIEMSSGKLVENTVRLWGNEIGAHTFHLGRGLGGAKDSLFHYKKGFSKREHSFNFWRYINNNKIYEELIQERCRITSIKPDNSYFPRYRHPVFSK